MILFSCLFIINSSQAAELSTKDLQTRIDPGFIEIYSNNQKNIIKQNEIKVIDEPVMENKLENKPQLTNEVPDIKFELKGVQFSGNTVIPASDLERFFKKYIGKEVSLVDIKKSIESITYVYQEMGYITSKAYIPPQTMEDGIVKIAVLEGKIGNIDVNKTKWVRSSYIKNNILKPNEVQSTKVFNINNLKSSFNTINSKEYLKGNVTLKKGTTPETTDIHLNIEEKFPLELSTTYDNLGRKYIGTQRADVTIGTKNLTGFGDRFNESISLSKGVLALNSNYSLPIGYRGMELQLGYSHSNVKLGDELKSQKIRGQSNMLNTGLSLPLYQKNRLNLNSDVAFNLLTSRISDAADTFENKYKLSVIRTGLNLSNEDRTGRFYSRFEVSTGLPLFGATRGKYDQSAPCGQFVKFEANVTRFQSLPYNTYGVIRASTQYSPFHLLAPEQSSLGGMYSVRGYSEGFLNADMGYNLSLELRKPIPYLPNRLPVFYWKHKVVSVPLKNRIFLATFYDQGLGYQLRQNVPFSYKNFIQSVGSGLVINISKYLQTNMYIGIPLGHKREESQNSLRFHFGLNSNFK